MRQCSYPTERGRERLLDYVSRSDDRTIVAVFTILEPVSVDASNWEEILIGSGYYTADQVK